MKSPSRGRRTRKPPPHGRLDRAARLDADQVVVLDDPLVVVKLVTGLQTDQIATPLAVDEEGVLVRRRRSRRPPADSHSLQPAERADLASRRLTRSLGQVVSSSPGSEESARSHVRRNPKRKFALIPGADFLQPVEPLLVSIDRVAAAIGHSSTSYSIPERTA